MYSTRRFFAGYGSRKRSLDHQLALPRIGQGSLRRKYRGKYHTIYRQYAPPGAIGTEPERALSYLPVRAQLRLSHLVLREGVELIDGAEHVDELDNSAAEQVKFPCFWFVNSGVGKVVSGGFSKRHEDFSTSPTSSSSFSFSFHPPVHVAPYLACVADIPIPHVPRTGRFLLLSSLLWLPPRPRQYRPKTWCQAYGRRSHPRPRFLWILCSLSTPVRRMISNNPLVLTKYFRLAEVKLLPSWSLLQLGLRETVLLLVRFVELETRLELPNKFLGILPHKEWHQEGQRCESIASIPTR